LLNVTGGFFSFFAFFSSGAFSSSLTASVYLEACSSSNFFLSDSASAASFSSLNLLASAAFSSSYLLFSASSPSF